jgi:hypothetical protein
MFLLNNVAISIDSEQVIGGIRYPHLRDPALREQLGVTEVADPEQYDQRFYWSPTLPKLLDDRLEVDQDGNPMYVKVLGVVDGEPAMVDSAERLVTKGLKSQWTAQVKDTAGSMLAQTDWYVWRKFERNIDVPAAVATKRAAIVAECDRLEAAIAACADVEALIAVVGAQNWPKGN